MSSAHTISALQVKLSCAESCTRGELAHCAAYFTPRHYENIVIERATSQRFCGFPLCRRTLDPERATGELHALLLMRMMRRTTGEATLFCSKTCKNSSRAFLNELRADVPFNGASGASVASRTAEILSVVRVNPPFGGFGGAAEEGVAGADGAAATVTPPENPPAPAPLPPASAVKLTVGVEIGMKKVTIVERTDVGLPSTDFSATAMPYAVEGHVAVPESEKAKVRDRFSAFVLLNDALAALCTARTARWLLALGESDTTAAAAAATDGSYVQAEAQRAGALSTLLGRHASKAGAAVDAEALLRGGQGQLMQMLGSIIRTFDLRRAALPSLKGQQWSALTLVVSQAIVCACCRGAASASAIDTAQAHTRSKLTMRRCKLSARDFEALVRRVGESPDASWEGLTLPPPPAP